MWGLIYYLPFYFQSVKAWGPISTGLSTLPALVTVTVGAVVTGGLVTRLRAYLGFVWAGWLLAAAACVLTVAWRFAPRHTVALWVVTYVVLGLGHGMVLNAGNFATQAMCRPGDEAAAAATYLFLRQLGAAVGVGVGGATFQNVLARRLESDGLPRAIAEDAEGFVPRLLAMPNDDSPEGVLKTRIVDAYDVGFNGVFAFYLGVAGVALIVSVLFIRHFPLDKELSSEHQLQATRVTRILGGKEGEKSGTGTDGTASAEGVRRSLSSSDQTV